MPTRNLTESQSARRERMLDAAFDLSVQGGWDAVQMREVAQRAEVALGTLYRYFPSKEHLLVSVMLEQVRTLADRLAVNPPRGGDPVERVNDVMRRANRNLQAQPEVTRAMIRALVAGNTDVAPVVSAVRDEMRRIFVDALANGSGAPSIEGDQMVVVDLLSDVWLAALVSWISGAQPVEHIVTHVAAATEALLGD